VSNEQPARLEEKMVQLVRLAARGARRGTRRDASGGVPLGRVRPGQAAARFLTSDKRGLMCRTAAAACSPALPAAVLQSGAPLSAGQPDGKYGKNDGSDTARLHQEQCTEDARVWNRPHGTAVTRLAVGVCRCHRRVSALCTHWGRAPGRGLLRTRSESAVVRGFPA